MSNYRKPCTGIEYTLWKNDVPYKGTMKQTGRMAQDTVELWRNYNSEEIKINKIELEDLSTLHQKISAGVNLNTMDIKKYLYACTGMFKQIVEIDLYVSPNYTIAKNTEINPLSLYKKPAVPVTGNASSQAKYKETLMNLLFSIRFQRAENNTHKEQLKKTIRKTKTNWNYPPWMNSKSTDSLDDVLAAYDWYLFLKETDDQPLRFGTVTTQWKGMGAFRDFCFISELFPGEPIRLVKWIQNSAIADSVLKMHLISSSIGEIGSSFPYCKAMGIVSKSDLSVSEHGSMHDYIQVTGMLLGNARSCNSRFISGSIARSDVCMAAMCIMATGAMKSGVQLDDDESRIINRTTAKALRVSEQEVSQMLDNVGIWMQTYNKDSNRIGIWIKSRLTSATKPRQYSVLKHLMTSHRDWVDIANAPPAPANQ